MSEIRSVSVHLDADVAGYIAKMKLAGAETDRAFSSSTKSIGGVNTSLSRTETELGNVDRAARRVDGALNRSGNGWTTYSKKVSGFLSNLSTLPGLALGATAALQPLAGAALAVGAAFAAPIAFGGGGLGLFAVLGLAGVAKTNSQLKAIDQLQKSLGTLTKGTQAYTDKQKELKAAQDALTPAQETYSKSLDHFGEAFDRLLGGKSGATLLNPISQAINLGADVLPKIQPILKATSDGLTTLLTDLDNFSQTKGFTSFVQDVAAQAGPDIVILGRAFGDLAHGVGDLLLASGKSNGAKGILHDFGRLSQTFSDWAGSKKARDDVRGLFDYFHKIGPDVATTLGSVADAVGAISKALKPIGPTELHVIGGIADAIAGIPVPTLTALAGAFTGLAVFKKVGGFKALDLLGTPLGKAARGGGPAGVASRATGVVPVFVTNEGFGRGGAPGVPTTTPGTRAPGAPVGGAPSLGLVLGGTGVLAGVTAGTDALMKKLYGDTLGSVFANIQSQVLGGLPQFHPKAVGLEGKVFSALLSGNLDEVGKLLNDRSDLGVLPKRPNLDFGAVPKIASTVASGVHAFLNIGKDKPPDPKPIQALGTAYEALKQHAADASRSIDLIGPHGANAAKQAGSAVKDLGGTLTSVNGGHASAALDLVGHSAQRAGQVGGSAIAGLHRAIDGLPPNKTVKVTADTGQSLAQLRAVASELAALRSKTITVTTNHATGGSVKEGLATGGYVTGPGGPTTDSIPAWLSNGEYVMNAAAVSQYGLDVMHAMNAGYFASGGPVNAHQPGDGGGSRDVPLFTGEGPKWYARAYKHGRPFALDGPAGWDWPYQTGFDSRKQARAFERWVANKNVPFDPDARIVDYDMRGFWKRTKGRGWHQGSHFPDTWKTPYDTTFSAESKYATKNNPFHWHGNKLRDSRNGQLIYRAAGGPVGAQGGGGGRGTSGVRGELQRLTVSLHAATKELDAETASLQSMRQARSQLASTVTGNLRSDPFAQPGGVWGSSTDPLANITTDIRNARRFRRLTARERRRGLHGAILNEVDTLADAQAIADYTPAELRRLSRRYAQRQRLTRADGATVADARYGKAIEEQTREVKAQRAEVHHLTELQRHANKELEAIKKNTHDAPHKMGQEINGTSSKADRRVRK